MHRKRGRMLADDPLWERSSGEGGHRGTEWEASDAAVAAAFCAALTGSSKAMRQQPGRLQHGDRGGAEVGQRRVIAALVQPLTCGGPALFGPVPQDEQRLLAAERRPGP